jgi:hypothetical protein
MNARLLAVAALLLLAACGSPPPPTLGFVPESLRDVNDPLVEIGRRLEAVGHLMEAASGDDEASSAARGRIADLSVEVAGLMGHTVFDPWPVTRATLRTRSLWLSDDDEATRRRALEECRTLWARLNSQMHQPGGTGGTP